MSGTPYLIVPLRPVLNQQLNVALNGQGCTINVYQKKTFVPISTPGSIPTSPPVYDEESFLLLDLTVFGPTGNQLVLAGVICEHANPIIRNTYLGFSGDLVFFDSQGTEDPQPSGLGTRWVLTYWPGIA